MARIVVIGSGLGAMAAAARLAVAGDQVTVFERGETFGGAVGRYTRDGFAFDTGPGLLQLPAVWRDLFVKTGREPLERCVRMHQPDPATRHLFADGTGVTLPAGSRSGVIGALDAALGEGAGTRWTDLVGRARTAWEATRRPLLEEPLTAATDPAPAARDPYPALRRRGLLRRRPPTLAEVAADELRDPRLVALLGSYALGYGYPPAAAPASATVLAYLEQTFGSWYVEGGLRELAAAVHRRCTERRVEFVFGAEVTEVLVADGRAAGVRLADGTQVVADAVVGGAHPGRRWPAGVPAPAGGAAPAGLGRLRVLLALRGARPADAVHRTVVHAADPAAEAAMLDATRPGPLCAAPTVTVLRPDDAALRPDDEHEAVTLTVTVPAHGPVDWAAEGAADAYADRVLAAVDAAGLGLGPRTLWREVRTPADTERETGAAGGAVPGPALAGQGGRWLAGANTGALPGFYRVGGSAHPGGGPAHAGMSGAMAAGLILEGEGWRGSQ
ncbi:NAD(P)/FAD-dependent oxidoreductase [Streptomyces sp. 549]|uniref:phytoene desaturase family protein n=1 Tax=Streptomyces sp. 549 TaxID=3049076 RepID=UPI0024C45AF1|nr:NAD(P)/FAD-dependent oxidoreductase [Streptomyces sp. 549]MDK1475577.1 NAD(P)/FAD-dependent oxidoreductase [Streptomyces sp. 549]